MLCKLVHFLAGQKLPESSSLTHFLFSDTPFDISSPAPVASLLLYCISSQPLHGLPQPGPYKGTILIKKRHVIFLENSSTVSHHIINLLHE